MATLYVDYTNGSDGNNGSTAALAVKTLAHALSLAASADTIRMRGGIHVVTSTITAADFTSLTIAPYDGESPVLTSRVAITGWTIFDAAKNIWRASAQGANSLDLIVNGRRSYIAQYALGDTSGWGSDSTGFSSTGGVGDGWGNPTKAYLLFYNPTPAPYCWTETKIPVTSITSTRINVDATAKGYWDQNVVDGAYGTPAYLINAYEALAATPIMGMHYIDTVNDYVYYRPRPGEDMGNVVAYIPQVDECLIRFTGCSNLTLNLTFADTTSLRPQKVGGFVENQSGFANKTRTGHHTFTDYSVVGGMVELDSCTTVDLTGSRFLHAGANALWCHNGTTGVTVDGSVFYDSGAAHIAFGQYSESNLGTPSGSSTIKRSYFHKAGQSYSTASHIIAYFCANLTLSDLTLRDNFYSGMQFIGGWDYDGTVTGGGHAISGIRIMEPLIDNRLRGNVGALNDGGAVYLNGKQTGTTITNVYVSRTAHPGSAVPVSDTCAGLYVDNDCRGVTASNFIVEGDFAQYFKENGNGVSPYNTLDNVYYTTGLTANPTNSTVSNAHASATPATSTAGSPTAPAIVAAVGLPTGYTDLAFHRPAAPAAIKAMWDFSTNSVSGTTIYDLSGNGNSLTTSGTPTYGTWRGNARAFTGRATGPTIITSGLNYAELVAWITPQTLPTHQIHIYNGSLAGDGTGIIVAGSGYSDGSGVLAYAAGVTLDAVGSSYTFTQGVASNIAIGRLDGTWRSFVNGAADHTGGMAIPVTPETGSFYINPSTDSDGTITVSEIFVTDIMRSSERDFMYDLRGSAPDAPQVVTATPGVSQVSVACESVYNASGYKLYRSTDDSSFSQVGSTSTTPSFTDSTAVNGTKYYYRITPTNAIGDGSQSVSAAATPTTAGAGGGGGEADSTIIRDRRGAALSLDLNL